MHLFNDKRIMFIYGNGLLTEACRTRLSDAGATVVGPVSSIDEAQAVLDSSVVDGAVVDLRTDDEMIITLADDFEALDIPFIFASSDVSAFDGFVLNDDPAELNKIAAALFQPEPRHTLH